MGKLLNSVLAISMAMTMLAVPAEAAVKAGAKCSKAGQSSTQGGYKYICIKSGKFLVWQKGTKVTESANSIAKSMGIRAKIGDRCELNSKWVIGAGNGGKLVYLSCGPDGKLHPQFGAPAIDQVTGKPALSKLGSTIMTTEYVIPPAISSRPLSALTAPGANVEPCKVLDAGPLGDIPDNRQKHFSAGFPIYPDRADLTKKVVIQFIPVDFADIKGKNAPTRDYEDVRKFLEDFFEKMGSKPIDLEIRIPKTYFHLPKPVLDYDISADFFKIGKPPTGSFDYARAAIATADTQINFTDVDIIAVVPPAEATASQVASFIAEAAEPNRGFVTSEKVIMNLLISSARSKTPYEYLNWAHETGHMFGLSDIRNVPDVAAQDVSPMGVFDLMNSMVAPELLAWQRFLLGTLFDNQVHCITKPGTTTSWLTPIEARDLGPKLAVIPTGKYTAVVVESRRSYGFDSNLGAANEGLIVYKIDTTIPYRKSPFRIIPSPSAKDETLRRDAALKIGESVTIDGVSITNTESGTFGDVAKITLE